MYLRILANTRTQPQQDRGEYFTVSLPLTLSLALSVTLSHSLCASLNYFNACPTSGDAVEIRWRRDAD